tara:strand:- start:130 stop:315 length:186 start_codon:yes stop_codon:yes gene_type:complete
MDKLCVSGLKVEIDVREFDSAKWYGQLDSDEVALLDMLIDLLASQKSEQKGGRIEVDVIKI